MMTYAELLRGFIGRDVTATAMYTGVLLKLRDDDAKPSRFFPTITDVGEDYIRLDYQKGKVRYYSLSMVQFIIGDIDEK